MYNDKQKLRMVILLCQLPIANSYNIWYNSHLKENQNKSTKKVKMCYF